MGVQSPSADRIERIAAVEQAFEAHWRHFGLYPGARLRDEDGVLWFESSIRHVPYNSVIRTRIPPTRDADAVIARVTAGFRQRNVAFMWVQRPSDQPADLGRLLAANGLAIAETAAGMDLGLDGYSPRPNTSGAQIVDAGADPVRLGDYEDLIRTYWSVPESERVAIQALNRYWTGARSPGIRLVAYLAGEPVGKLFMNTQELPERVGIYGLAVRPASRGRGIARAMMDEALTRAKDAGASRCVVHSSTMALPLFAGMGFVARCSLPIYATGEIVETHHS